MLAAASAPLARINVVNAPFKVLNTRVNTPFNAFTLVLVFVFLFGISIHPLIHASLTLSRLAGRDCTPFRAASGTAEYKVDDIFHES